MCSIINCSVGGAGVVAIVGNSSFARQLFMPTAATWFISMVFPVERLGNNIYIEL